MHSPQAPRLAIFCVISIAQPALAGSISGNLSYDGPPGETGRPGNKALSLDGSGDYVQTPLNDLSGSEITIAYWFKGSVHRSVVRQQSSGYIVAGYTDQHILSNDGGLSGVAADATGGTTVQDGQWHHVAMTWKQGTSNGFTTYLDGDPVATRNSGSFAIPNHNIATYIGSANGTGEFTNGMIDDVAIWKRALDGNEIRSAMDAPLVGNEDGLAGYWNFDDGTAVDLSPSGNDGTLFGDATIVDAEDLGGDGGKFVIEATPDGPPNHVLCLDGIDDHAVVASLTSLAGSEITISYWFRGSFHRSIVRQQSNLGYVVAGYSGQHIISNDGALSGVSSDGADATVVQDGEWHHLVMTWKQGAVDGFSSYLDGQPVESRNSAAVAIPNLNAALHIGSANAEGEFANGCVDEVTVWSRALSPEEVAEGWNQRLDGDEAGLVGYWTFDDGTADDRSSNGHDALLVGGAAIVAETIPNLDGIPLTKELGDPGSYLLEGAPEGIRYFVDAYYDRNGNGIRDDDEWRGSLAENPIRISGDLTESDISLYDPSSVWLDITRSEGLIEVIWPEFATGMILTSSPDLAGESWQIVPGDFPATEGVRSYQTSPSEDSEFFRLEDRQY